MDPLHHELLRALATPPPLAPGARLLVACSGGPDSLALTHALAMLAPSRGWELHAAHVDHALRPDSATEGEHLAHLLAALGLDLLRARVTVDLREAAGGLEAVARMRRYEALERLAREVGATEILTAHHADDQLETALLRLVHGTMGGLRGMPARRELADGLWLRRPCLQLPRAALRAYLDRHGLVPLEDPSNAELDRERNRLRHRVLPELVALNPRVAATVARQLAQRAADEELLDRLAREALAPLVLHDFPGILALERAGLLALAVPLRSRALVRSLARVGLGARERTSARLERLDECLVAGSGGMDLGEGVHAHVQGDRLWLWGATVPASEPAGAGAGAWGLALEPGNPVGGEAVYDLAALGPGWCWRSARAEDRFRPWGRLQEGALPAFLQRARIPGPLRSRWPVLARGAEIAWVAGLRRGCQAPLTPATKRAVRAVNRQRPWFDKVLSGPYHDETMLGGCDPIE